MASAFDKFIAVLSGNKDGVLPSAQTFPPIDVQQLEMELRASTAARGAVTDLEIRAALELHARKAEDAFRAQLVLYEARIRHTRVLSIIGAEIQAEGENALSDFKVQTVDEKNRLHQLQEQVAEHDAEVRRFRAAHGITRPARVISTGRLRFGVALLMLFMVAETILNGTFFAHGSELGLIGGVVEAAVLAAINIGSAVLFAAYALPYLRHGTWFGKLVGLCSLLAYLIWVLGFNFAIAHYRDLFAATQGQVAPSTWLAHMVEDPTGLTSMQSWILGLLGIGFSVATVIDVQGMRDGYPGYGSLAKGRREALDNYVGGLSESLLGLQGTRDEAVEGMSSVVSSLREAQYDLELAITGRTRLLENMRAYYEHLRIVYRQLATRLMGVDAPDTSWLLAPEVPPLPEQSTRDSDAVAKKMETLIGQVNAHYVDAANQFASARLALEKGVA